MRHRAPRLPLCALAVATIALAAIATPARAQDHQETYRPQFHFTPASNWMNDPNGLVYYKGEYHLFFQHNPFGNTWGHMSWGHAVSRDLVHWKQLPLAIPEQGDEAVFSGSAVVDVGNTSGLGTEQDPPMVAIYTAAKPGSQAQSLAYSTDRGRTWKRYAGNPVLDIGSGEFRDPKVFWYAPGKRWVMSVSHAVEHRISFYSSPDLEHWSHLSDFGPQAATGGAWECPDLFPLRVEGTKRTKWVLVVNINPGGIAGGSGAQYFVGDFDGTTFTPDQDGSYTPPAGEVLADFEGSSYPAGWTTTGTAFGSGPAHGTLPGQQQVSGFAGGGLVNSFSDGDFPQGTLTSAPFTLTHDYVNFLVGGGAHAHDPAAGDGTPPAGDVIADFEGPTFGDGWVASGDFDGAVPHQGGDGGVGAQVVDTFFGANGAAGDPLTGRIVSPDFTITRDYLDFEIAGGNHPWGGDGPTAVNLVVDGQVVRTATGADGGTLNWKAWDVSALRGQSAHLEIVDQATGGWGHVLADHFVLSDVAAKVRGDETAVNLVVDGQVVRSTAGAESEALDWAGWDVRDLRGKTAQIQIADRNSGGWGHVLADHIMLADAPAQPVLERAGWLDYGKDYYAAVSWNGVPDGRRVMIGWMNNWQYANQIPTSPWRSAMSVPREVTLAPDGAGGYALFQRPVRELGELRTGRRVELHDQDVPAGVTEIPRAAGKALDITASFEASSARRFGLQVRAAGDEQTVIGYDAEAGELYVDRRASGDTSFSPDFASAVQRVKLAPGPGGRVKLHVLVDWSSVEVFANGGRRVITDQVFPRDGSQAVRLFAEGGTARLRRLSVSPLRSAW